MLPRRRTRRKNRHLRQRGGADDFKTVYERDLQGLIAREGGDVLWEPLIQDAHTFVNYTDNNLYERIYHLNPKLSEFVTKHFIVTSDVTLDIEWARMSDEYVDGLPHEDRLILSRYTAFGDELVNTLLRFGDDAVKSHFRLRVTAYPPYIVQLMRLRGLRLEDNPVTMSGSMSDREHALNKRLISAATDEELLLCVKHLCADLVRIIDAAPKPTRHMRLLRGVSDDYLKGMDGVVFRHKNFISTTYSPHTSEWLNEEPTNYVYTIDINKATPCISMKNISQVAGEFEIFIAPGMDVRVGEAIDMFVFNSNQFKANALALQDPFDSGVKIMRTRHFSIV